MNLANAKISIEPYFDPNIPNQGLENYGLATFPETELQEFITLDEHGRYVTGLDVDAPSVVYLEDQEEKEAKEKEITDIIKRLERVLGIGKLNATNHDFWSTFILQIKNGQRILDIRKPLDEVIYHAIRAGGFEEIAPSYEHAQKSNKIYKYYLKRDDEEAAVKMQYSKLIGKAKGILVDMSEDDQYKMFLISKTLLTPSNEFKRTTAPDIIYGKLELFIEGTIVKDNKKDTVKQFLDAVKQDKETLTIKAYVTDAVYHRMIVQESDGHFYNKQTQTRYGKNLKEVINYLKNPINQSELDNISARVEKKWNS